MGLALRGPAHQIHASLELLEQPSAARPSSSISGTAQPVSVTSGASQSEGQECRSWRLARPLLSPVERRVRVAEEVGGASGLVQHALVRRHTGAVGAIQR